MLALEEISPFALQDIVASFVIHVANTTESTMQENKTMSATNVFLTT